MAEDTVCLQPVSGPKFPANREFNREFFKFGLLSAILALNRRANSIACGIIPYSMEQGIFLTEQGIFAAEQGMGLGLHPCGETQKSGAGCDGAHRGLRRSGRRPRLLVWLGGASRSRARRPLRRERNALDRGQVMGGSRPPTVSRQFRQSGFPTSRTLRRGLTFLPTTGWPRKPAGTASSWQSSCKLSLILTLRSS